MSTARKGYPMRDVRHIRSPGSTFELLPHFLNSKFVPAHWSPLYSIPPLLPVTQRPGNRHSRAHKAARLHEISSEQSAQSRTIPECRTAGTWFNDGEKRWTKLGERPGFLS